MCSLVKRNDNNMDLYATYYAILNMHVFSADKGNTLVRKYLSKIFENKQHQFCQVRLKINIV